MHNFTTLEKKENISYQEFVKEHEKKGVPVVFKNASSSWKSNKIFTPDFFRDNFGSYKTEANGVTYTMVDILKLTAESTPEKPAPYPILFEIPLQIPELLEMFAPIHMNYATPNWFNSKIFPYGKFGNNTHLFIGGKGNQYILHKDTYHTNAWITQLYGRKKFIVFPKDHDELLYPGKSGIPKFLSPINILNPDLEKYPKFKNATPIEIVLEPGETIFIPNGVWHTTVADEQNISLIFDQLNGNNFKAWKKDIYDLKKDESKLKAAIGYSYASIAGLIAQLSGLTKV